MSRTRTNFPERKNQRFKDAVAREVDSEGRSPDEQIHRLDKRLGKGVGAVKERARLTNNGH